MSKRACALLCETTACGLCLDMRLRCLCSIFMGNVEVTTQHNQVIKMATGTYEFGANLVSNQVRLRHESVRLQFFSSLDLTSVGAVLQGNFMIGRIQTDGRLVGRAK